MKSLDEQEKELEKLTNSLVEERIKEVNNVIKESDEFIAFLDLWVNEIEKHFGKCKVQYRLKGKKEWVS